MKTDYDRVAKLLHWGVVLLVGVQFITAWIAPEVRGKDLPPVEAISVHMSFGVVIIALMLLRFGWRLLRRPPGLPAHMGPMTRFATFAGHSLLYVLLFAVPLTGWALASVHDWQPTLFGLYTLPVLVSDPILAHGIGMLHGALATLILLIIIGHIAAAIYHKIMHDDGVWERILPEFLAKKA